MNREKVLNKRRELLKEENEIYEKYQSSKNRKERKELEKQLVAIGDELCTLRVGNGSKILEAKEIEDMEVKENFKPWDKFGYRLNKIDFIKALLHGYGILELCKLNFMDSKTLSNLRNEWDIEFLTPKFMSQFKPDDLPFILEALEELENTGVFKIFGHELELI